LPPSSPIASEAVKAPQLKLVEKPETIIRYAETDEELCAIHRMLLIVLAPQMRCKVNPVKSLLEIIRVAKENVAIVAMQGDMMVGTLGIIDPTWWYGDDRFLTERWLAVADPAHHSDVYRMLLDEARKISADAGIEFILQGKIRRGKDGLMHYLPKAYPVESAMMAEGA
jgi:hypothetical protein